MALPMKQVRYTPSDQAIPREQYSALLDNRKETFSGFSWDFIPRSTFADTPEQRLQTYENLWAKGDFQFWLATYQDTLFDLKANGEAYKFWRNKVRARIHDLKTADVLAPMQQPHAFGCKRVSLEDHYFEIFNESHVTLVDVSANGTPIERITEHGVKTTDKEIEVDVIVCATGYDAVTGGLTQIDIRGRGGRLLREKWANGAQTFLGMASHDFPNMFFTYGPQAPTAFCNGPTCAELQGNWILNTMNHIKEHALQTIEVKEESQKQWKELVWKLASKTLLPAVDSWYMGTNIPGKPREPLVYLGGVSTYHKTLEDVAAKGYEGLTLA